MFAPHVDGNFERSEEYNEEGILYSAKVQSLDHPMDRNQGIQVVVDLELISRRAQSK